MPIFYYYFIFTSRPFRFITLTIANPVRGQKHVVRNGQKFRDKTGKQVFPVKWSNIIIIRRYISINIMITLKRKTT